MIRKLTLREAEVVVCLLAGLSNGQIAERLGLRRKTVDGYIFEIANALEVRTARGIMALFVCERAIEKLERITKWTTYR